MYRSFMIRDNDKLAKRVATLEFKLKQMEAEYKAARESVEYLTSEGVAQSDQLKEVQTSNDGMSKLVGELQSRLKEVENDYREAKESVDFVVSEQTILAEELKEVEDNLNRERSEWDNERHELLKAQLQQGTMPADAENRTSQQLLMAKYNSERIIELESQLDNSKKLLNTINDDIADSLLAAWNDFRSTALSNITTSNGHCEATSLEALTTELIASKGLVVSVVSQVDELKQEVHELVAENMSLKSAFKQDELKNALNGGHKSDQDETLANKQQQRLNELLDDIDELSEKKRVSDALVAELRTQIKELSTKEFGSCLVNNPLVLRQEVKALKEQVQVKEETLQKLACKFQRNRDVWLANEKKANGEIKKLDELIDRMVTAMSTNTEAVRRWPEMQVLLEELSDVQAEKSFAV